MAHLTIISRQTLCQLIYDPNLPTLYLDHHTTRNNTTENIKTLLQTHVNHNLQQKTNKKLSKTYTDKYQYSLPSCRNLLCTLWVDRILQEELARSERTNFHPSFLVLCSAELAENCVFFGCEETQTTYNKFNHVQKLCSAVLDNNNNNKLLTIKQEQNETMKRIIRDK